MNEPMPVQNPLIEALLRLAISADRNLAARRERRSIGASNQRRRKAA